MAAVGKGVWQLSLGEKSQLGAPADCLNFPSHFLLNIVSAQFDYVVSVAICSFTEKPPMWSHSPMSRDPSGQDQPLKGFLS